MTEEFKQRLKRYDEGALPPEEREALEKELDKLELYQAYLEERLGPDRMQSPDKKREPELETVARKPLVSRFRFVRAWGKGSGRAPSGREERRVVSRGKWKARFANAGTLLALLCIGTIICGIVTSVFYATGGRGERYRDAVLSALAVSRPNVRAELNSSSGWFFTLNLDGKLRKQVGDDRQQVGDINMRFLLGLPGSPMYDWSDDRVGSNGLFYYPAADESKTEEARKGVQQETQTDRGDSADWNRLEKLPEGTVAEAFLSLDRLYTTDELLQIFEGLNMDPVWFAVDAGQSGKAHENFITAPLGFPYRPEWHSEDLEVTQREEIDNSGWMRVTMTSGQYPSLESYGDGEKREAHFIKTLRLLQEYPRITGQVAPFIDVEESARYVESHGVRLYGVAVTGPVKELLKLKSAPWVSYLRIGEVALWNWSADRPF